MAGVGALSRLARTQYSALAAMRWQMFRNRLRSREGVFELGARVVGYLIYAGMGLGLGAGAGALAYGLTARAMWELLPGLFWGLFFIWQMIPVALASFQEQYDLSGLLRFPVSFSAFFLLYLVFGLMDISTLLGGLCCIGILVGVSAARPDLFATVALALAALAAFNILLARVILAWIDRWLSQRRTRELVSAAFMLFLLSLQLLNPALHEKRRAGAKERAQEAKAYRQLGREMEPWMRRANALQKWLPPGLAAEELTRAAGTGPRLAAGSLSLLGLYVLGAGGLLAVRLRAEYRGENLGDAPQQKREEKRSAGWLLDGAGPLSAVMEKELRTVMRSMPLIYSVGAPLFMVIILGSLFHSNAPGGGHLTSLALPLCVGYALLGSSQIIYNNLGGEGAGVQLLFLSPTPIRTVLLAKNLFHALLFSLVALLAGILASLRLGWPDATLLAATMAWVLFALPANLTVGNIFSLIMPHRMNLGRMGRQHASASSALLSMLVQFALLGVGAAVFVPSAYFGRLWLAVPIFLALAAGAVFAWLRVLRNCDAMANQRRETLMSVLAKAE